MNPAANVRSRDALVEWRAALSTFQHEAAEVIAALQQSIQHAHAFVADTRHGWQSKLRDAQEAVTQARTELSNRKFVDYSGRMPDTELQERNLRRAVAFQEFVEERLEATHHWMTRLDRMVNEVYHTQARRLGNFVEGELVQAIHHLAQQVASLDAYFAAQAPSTPS